MVKRRRFILSTLLLPLTLIGSNIYHRHARASHEKIQTLNLSRQQWRDRLNPSQYAILRNEDTEPPFSSPLNHEHRFGIFACAGCDLALFESKRKYDSGTGWPSFTQAIAGHTGSRIDFKNIWPRTEYHCNRCGGHQGHLFNDGPQPTGKRWCNNGLALKFILHH